MSDANLESDETTPENSARAGKTWKTYLPEVYAGAVNDLVHFCSKTVNSNSALVGIRLSPDDALDAPYVAARTLLAREVSLELDYGKGGAAVAGICKQVNAVLRNEPLAEQASKEERTAIEEAMEQAKSSVFLCGTDYVDHRLRQILIPRKDTEGGYVAVTPITAGGICALLFGEDKGLVTLHNRACDEGAEKSGKDTSPVADKETIPGQASEQMEGLVEGTSGDLAEGKNEEQVTARKRKLRQAQFGIGGSKPQNVGGFAFQRLMQQPLFMDAPRGQNRGRKAYSVYYKGISLDFSRNAALREALAAYVAFRKRLELDKKAPSSDSYGRTHLKARQEEERLVEAIACTVLQEAEAARQLLREYADILPQETNPGTGLKAMVSPHLKQVLRGLFDASLRYGAWPRDMAELVSNRMEQASNSGNHVLVLDTAAKATVRGILEEAFR